MPNFSNSLSAVLLGTNTDKRWTVLLHVLSWVAAYSWFFYESLWSTGGKYPSAITLIALNKWVVTPGLFYAVLHIAHWSKSNYLAVLRIALVLGFALTTYCLVCYHLYRRINIAFPDLSVYFHNIVKNISAQGPWAFLHNVDYQHFNFVQLNVGLLFRFLLE